jgi:DNA polymerase-3 subunit alpha
MSDFIHLHVHTEYSLLDGLIKIPDLLDKTAEYGMDSVAVTDHGVLYSAFKFYREATNKGIKPIIGMEAYQAENSIYKDLDKTKQKIFHLVLLAKNLEGYKNLMRLTTIAHLEGYKRKPRIDLDILSSNSKGLICLSGCLNSQLSSLLLEGEESKAQQLVERLLGIFPDDRFYLELQKHPKLKGQETVNKKLIDLSRSYGIPLVATNDVHYLTKDDAEAHEILLCVQTGHTILEKTRPLSMIDSPDFYFRSPSKMKELFIEYPEAIENTVKIAQMCDLKLQEGKFILPLFTVPEGTTPEEYLRRRSFKALKDRYPSASREIKERLEYELGVIIGKGYSTYFLIVADFVNWAKKQGIAVGPGRGSVAGSIVSYLLGITQLDPLEHELPFERFLSPARPSPPDIDLDFADDRRDEVIEYVVDKYGKKRVAQIITFGTMEARQAIRDAGRALGMPYSQPDRIAKMMPPGYQGFKVTIDRALDESRELKMAYSCEEDTKKLIDLARHLEGVARHASVHAAGVVIADKKLTEYTPLQKEPRGGEKIITQYDMYSLDINAAPGGRAIGLLKMDFLGLRNLTILQNAIRYVFENKKIKLDIDTIPTNDTKVYKTISSGETTGVFQLESRGMRELARKLKPTKFSDIAAMVALFRPGPMGWIDDFVSAKKNPANIKYPHKDLKSILAQTYGIAVYQEQCMQIANKLAGFTMTEADGLRYAIGKKKKKAMEQEKKKFIKGCIENGYKAQVAENIWSLIEKFVGYGFNKAHAASYAMIAYQTAYMKTHYPVEFMTAVFSAESRSTSGPIRDQKMARAVQECRRMGIKLLPPDINKSKSDFAIEDNGIRFGLSAIKNVGEAAVSSILEAREKKGDFLSLYDFCARVNLSKVTKKTLESLIKAGSLDKFGKRSAMLSALPEIVSDASKLKKRRASGQVSIFDTVSAGTEEKKLPSIEELSERQILSFEKEYLGFYLTQHPIASYKLKITKNTTHAIGELNRELTNQRVKIGGVITQIKKITTRKLNQEMAFARVEDQTGAIETVIFPRIYRDFRLSIGIDKVVLVSGTLNERDKDVNLIVEKITEI